MLLDILSPMNITIAILIGSSIFFVKGKIRSDLVAMCALLLLVITNILTPTQAFSGFSNSVVLTMVGLFIVGGGIFRTGLAKLISSRILRLAGNSETKLFLFIMLVTSFLGGFVSSSGTVAVMIPIVVSIALSAKITPRKLLIPLAFASSMGGMLTLIGTSPNLVINEELQKNGYGALSFFSFTPIGILSLVIGIIGLAILNKYVLSKDNKQDTDEKTGKSLNDLSGEYQLHNLDRILVLNESELVGKTLCELSIPSKYHISVVTIEKKINNSSRFGTKIGTKNIEEVVAGPSTLIEGGDILVCYGNRKDINRFLEENKLTIDSSKKEKRSIFDFEHTGLAEVYILPNSKLVNFTVMDTHFREQFNVNILGIQRDNEYHMKDLQDQKLCAGDALLIQGTWNNIVNLGNRQDDLILVGQPLEEAAKVTLDHKAPVAALIMILMVVAMVTNLLVPVIAVLVAANLMVITGCLRNMKEAYNTINWESIVLIAGMMPIALAFQETGAVNLISTFLVKELGQIGPHALLAGVYFGTSLLTMFISNTATTLLFAPIGMHVATRMGVSPYPFMFAVTVAASMCFASPFSTAPNVIIMSAGKYTFMDFVKVGLPLQIVMGIIMILALPLFFPF